MVEPLPLLPLACLGKTFEAPVGAIFHGRPNCCVCESPPMGQYWPLVKSISISGPFAILKSVNGKLVDLPGLQDANMAQPGRGIVVDRCILARKSKCDETQARDVVEPGS